MIGMVDVAIEKLYTIPFWSELKENFGGCAILSYIAGFSVDCFSELPFTFCEVEVEHSVS